jgi:hypothetical protein
MTCLGVVGDAERMAATPRQPLDRQCMHAAQSPSAHAPRTSPCAAYTGDPVRIRVHISCGKRTRIRFPRRSEYRACAVTTAIHPIQARTATSHHSSASRLTQLTTTHRKPQHQSNEQSNCRSRKCIMHADADADGSHRPSSSHKAAVNEQAHESESNSARAPPRTRRTRRFVSDSRGLG